LAAKASSATAVLPSVDSGDFFDMEKPL